MTNQTTTAFIDSIAQNLRGNWRKFNCFYWDNESELPDSDNWCIVYTHNRDSGLLTESNAHAIAQIMEPFLEGDDLLVEDHNHWVVGWVAGYSIRVYKQDTKNEYTPAFLAWCDIQNRLENYPVLDEEDWSARELEACLKNIGYEGGKFVDDKYKDEDWVSEVYGLLPDNETQNSDGRGAYPSEESIATALYTLGWLDEDYLYLIEED